MIGTYYNLTQVVSIDLPRMQFVYKIYVVHVISEVFSFCVMKQNCVKSVIGRLRIGASPSSSFTTSTTPKLNPQTISAHHSANNPRSVKYAYI